MSKNILGDKSAEELMRDGKAIVLVQQEDGNWKGLMVKNGELIKERQVDPIYVLQALLTSDGKSNS